MTTLPFVLCGIACAHVAMAAIAGLHLCVVMARSCR